MLIMKKQIISSVCLLVIVVLLSYLFAILKIDFKIAWGGLFLVLAYLGCVMTRKLLKPSIALFIMLAGIIIVHIPWWISHHVNYDISFYILIDYFFKGTKMSYSIMGIIAGYLLYKLTRLFIIKPLL